MIDREHIVVAVVAAAGEQLVSRIRLQKTVYLLDRVGLRSGFSYEYHHFGPYSRDLDNAATEAQAFDLLEETFDRRLSDGARYSVFKAKTSPQANAYGDLSPEKSQELVREFAATNVTVLELAATIDWLWRVEGYTSDWNVEIEKRKGRKVGGGRLGKAIDLLKALKLEPPTPAAA